MKVKIELTLDADELLGKVGETLQKATSDYETTDEVLSHIQKDLNSEGFSPAAAVEKINEIRKSMVDLDIQLSNATSMLISYEATRLNKIAAEKQLAEQGANED